MSETTFIYGWCDPVSGDLRYIGKSNNPVARLKGHFAEARKNPSQNHRLNLLRKWALEQVRPQLILLLEVQKRDWAFWERDLIAHFRHLGCDLVNGTEGGDGGDTGWKGRKRSPEFCKKISEAKTGGKMPPEWCDWNILRLTGRKQSAETIEKRVSKIRGMKQSPEARQKHSNYKRDYWASLSAEERKLRCAHIRSFRKT